MASMSKDWAINALSCTPPSLSVCVCLYVSISVRAYVSFLCVLLRVSDCSAIELTMIVAMIQLEHTGNTT